MPLNTLSAFQPAISCEKEVPKLFDGVQDAIQSIAVAFLRQDKSAFHREARTDVQNIQPRLTVHCAVARSRRTGLWPWFHLRP